MPSTTGSWKKLELGNSLVLENTATATDVRNGLKGLHHAQLTGAKPKAGLNTYQAVAAATICQQFVFGYDATFTIGYLLSLP